MADVEALFDDRAAQAGLAVSPDLKAKLLAYYAVLEHWNRKINLTSLGDPVAAIDRLLLEPLSASAYLPASVPMADLGSGGGSPAIPLALALHAPFLLMVESRARKAAFLREAARVVGINATVEAVRFEALVAKAEHERTVDLVTIRAVKPDASVLSLAAHLTRAKGTVALFVSQDQGGSIPSVWPERSTWNIQPSGMLITFHVEHD